MIFTLGLNELPFKPDMYQIIYIEGNHDEVVTHQIERHFQGIKEYFKSKGYDFCYIPYLKYDLSRGEKLHYNAPYAKAAQLKFMTDDNFILNYMVNPENREKIPPSLIYFIPGYTNEDYPEADCLFRGIKISGSTFEFDGNLKDVLNEILKDIDENSLKLRFHKVSDGSEDKCEESIGVNADEEFDYESKILVQEIKERVNKLRQKGIDEYIISQIFQHHERKLSRVRITKDYRIFLGDYFGMEIKMTPLPKAVFLLFLKHPEGIMFSHLPDYREELMEIYKKVKGPFYNEEQARKSIEDVTYPLSNSINEKCSRIREAFVSQFDEHLARYYYVDGKRAEPKKIALPRNMVKWEE